MNTLEYIIKKFRPDIPYRSPIKICNVNRTIMAKVLGELNFKEGAEIGVAEGNHAKVLCENNPGAVLHCIDVWEMYPGYSEYGQIGQVYYEARERLGSYNVQIHKMFSMNAVKFFEDDSLDFVYIDGAHDFKSVTDDVCEWSKKVRVGGIVFGHDFKRSSSKSKFRLEVKDVIPAFCYAKNIQPWFVLTNDVRDPTFGHDNPGWMFVRQERDLI